MEYIFILAFRCKKVKEKTVVDIFGKIEKRPEFPHGKPKIVLTNNA